MDLPIKEEYQSLYEKFQKLKTIEEKLHFWNCGNLPLNYIQYQDNADPELYNDLSPFYFEVPKQEWQMLNQWILKNYYKYSTNDEKTTILYPLEDLQDSFDFELEQVNESDKIRLIKEEIRKIDSSFKIKVESSRGLIRSTFSEERTNQKLNANYKSYKDFLEYKGLEPDYGEVKPFLYNTLRVANGVTFAKYVVYLEKKLESLEGNEIEEIKQSIESISNKKRKVTEPQQVLIFHYLGLLKPINGLPIQEQQKAKLVSTILNTGLENTEKYMRKIGVNGSRTYTESNYQFLVDFFEEVGLLDLRDQCHSVLVKIRAERGKK